MTPEPSTSPAEAPSRASRLRPARRPPFFGLLESIITEDGAGPFVSPGAIARADAEAVWTWFHRDVAAELIDPRLPDGEGSIGALDQVMPEVLNRARELVAAAGVSSDVEHRVKAQVGGDATWRRVPIVLTALKVRALLEKARSFGRATNNLADEAQTMTALQMIPRQDQAIAALLFQAAIGQVTNPGRLMTAVTRIAGGATESAIDRAGFGPLIEALLAHAQNQLPTLMQWGSFADFDLTCRAIDRFNRLLRAVTGYIELTRLSRWSGAVGMLVSAASERIEPHLRNVVPDVSRALRKTPGATDRVDSDQMLAAFNGVYLLATVRECRDSLALNALFDQTWAQVGTALEQQIERNLEALRQNAADPVAAERLKGGLKMAELRFNSEYADMMRRAQETILGKRVAKAS
jgi:hypothetical protein